MKTSSFAIDERRLAEITTDLGDSFAQATPFPHVVIDDLLPADVLDAVIEEFPTPEAVDWQTFDDLKQKKLALADTREMGPVTRQLLAELNSAVFIDFLEQVTSIPGLVPDPHYVGGGLHQIQRGGYLKVHADFNRHKRLELDRRLNLLVYLNKDWDESYGGHLELWDHAMEHCEVKVTPVFNRAVVFATTDFSYHGHPNPLTCPPERARRSLALYYYSNGRPEAEVSRGHETLFRSRPGENLSMLSDRRQAIARCVPPVLLDASRDLRSWWGFRRRGQDGRVHK
jgi:Rps23 Pro-64 3,4-dihydroxylase Tpa1-like proline 4-hydroxylase